MYTNSFGYTTLYYISQPAPIVDGALVVLSQYFVNFLNALFRVLL